MKEGALTSNTLVLPTSQLHRSRTVIDVTCYVTREIFKTD